MGVAFMTKEQIKEAIRSMTVLELADLVKELEEEFGVTAAAPMAMVAAAPAGETAAAEEKVEFKVTLKVIGDNKIPVVKVVREVTGLGLKEAKDLVDGAPSVVKEGVTKEEAATIKSKLEEVGATVAVE